MQLWSVNRHWRFVPDRLIWESICSWQGRGSDRRKKEKSILSDALEAVIGAIYLDGGFANAKEFILKYILNDIEHKQLFYDSKTILQEIVQAEYGEVDLSFVR